MVAQMQSLIDTGESLNLDDLENTSNENSSESRNNSKFSESQIESDQEDFFSSSGSTAVSSVKSLNIFDDLEMKRCKLETELGIE